MKFIKVVLGSCLGALLALGALFLIGMIFISAAASGLGESKVTVKSGSVLHLDFSSAMPEQTNNVPSDYNQFNTDDVLGLTDGIAAIEKAKDDKRISAILLDLTNIPMGMAATSEFRQALIDFKENTDKPIYAYADYFSHKSYGVATTADTILMNPNGMMELKGFGYMGPFFKELLDKIGVEAQVFYAGDFKSATEPFRYNKMSSFNREQIRDYLGDLYNTHITEVTTSRNINKSVIDNIAENEVFVNPEEAVERQLIDGIAYRDQLNGRLKAATGKDKLNFISLSEYASDKKETDYSVKNKIAVVYAEGDIVNASDKAGTITYNGVGKALSDLVDNEKVKAVVLRINSGGGDALTSDNIWREVERLKEAGKPVVASFSDVAASGGYYIAAGADKIYAQPNTITGSIGVFGMLPDASTLMEDKLGVHWDTVQTEPHATSFGPFRSLSEKEFGMLQGFIDEIYDQFTGVVAQGRNLEMAKVKEIARGRVYSGARAQELGLVDEMGGLQDAIAEAASMAEIDSYRMVEYPKRKDPIQQLLEDFMGAEVNADAAALARLAGPLSPYMKYMIESQRVQQDQGLRPQAKMHPFFIEE